MRKPFIQEYHNIEIIMTLQEAKRILATIFELTGDIRPLPGEIDVNFLVTSPQRKYVLKIAHSDRALDNLQLQNDILLYLQKQNIPIQIPEVVRAKNGDLLSRYTLANEQVVFVRLLTWIEGSLLAKVKPHSKVLLQSLGETCGHLCYALQDYSHPSANRYFKWNNSEANWIEEKLHFIKNDDNRALVRYFLTLFQEEVVPHFDKLRKSINYNDANDYNVLVATDLARVVGVIDFGDVVYTHTINEIAIAAAYAIMDKPDPLAAAVEILKGFHAIFPVKEEECSVLFPLIATRLIISVTVASMNEEAATDNPYLLISTQPAWSLLKKLRNISPAFAHYVFRAACGYMPCPINPSFLNFIQRNKGKFASVVAADLQKDDKIILDLSVGSKQLGNNPNFEDSHKFERLVNRLMEEEDVAISIGKYREIRPIYTSDAFAVIGNEGPRWRTMHIGLDVFMKSGTPVYAPLDGIVHSFHNNEGDRDYGPTIILRHTVAKDLTFYTLYGHLSLSSLNDLRVGMEIRRGQQIATIGARPVNGDWPPHLHFQIILDMLGYEGDFPGVAFPEQEKVWTSLCPNPNLLIGIEGEVVAKERYLKKVLRQKRQKYLGKNLSLSYDSPLRIQRGYMQYLYNQNGRRFLDTVNNVPHVGHQNPNVVKAAQEQIAVFNSNTRYLHQNLTEYAERLCATLPSELSVCYFVNSGSEANELAMRLARTYTQQQDFVVLEVGYHGNTQNCIDISSYKFDGKGGGGKAAHTHVVPMPDTFRGVYKEGDSSAGKKYAGHIERVIQENWKLGKDIAGFFCESILSCGGQIVLPPGYLKEAYAHVRKAGGICIADEVQVGFGRVGSHFWGFELQGVIPDIVTMGKPIGNGHPLGAVVTTKEIARVFDNGMEYFNTFGGNPVSCAIGLEVLKIIEEEKLQDNALKIGTYLKQELKKLSKRFPIIGDVRGEGLFLGFELVEDTQSILPASKQTKYLINRMRHLGILMSSDGLYHNVIKIKPPIIFNQSNADFLLEGLENVLKDDFMQV